MFASADCDSGDKLLGGGGQALSPTEDDTTASLLFIEGQGWDYQIQDNGGKLVHRHADPLVDKTAPATILHR